MILALFQTPTLHGGGFCPTRPRNGSEISGRKSAKKTLKKAFSGGRGAKPYTEHVFGLGHEWKVGAIGFEAVFW